MRILIGLILATIGLGLAFGLCVWGWITKPDPAIIVASLVVLGACIAFGVIIAEETAKKSAPPGKG